MNERHQILEQILILRCQMGDKAAFAELFNRHEAPLRYFVSHLLADKQTSDDMLQEIWLSVLAKISTLKKADAFRAWLYRIARNKVYQQLRRTQQATKIQEELPLIAETEDCEFSAEDAERIHQSLAKLKIEHREALMLRFLEQMPYQQMAEVTGCNVGTIRSRIHYAKLALRQELEK